MSANIPVESAACHHRRWKWKVIVTTFWILCAKWVWWIKEK